MSDSIIYPARPDESLPVDGEIRALLEFEPVPRKVKRKDGWFPHLQREFIHRLALCGSPGEAARQMRKNVSGIENIYREDGADSFRAAWDGALELAWAREAEAQGPAFEGRAPGIRVRGGGGSSGGWDGGGRGPREDPAASLRATEELRDKLSDKLRQSRRFYLHDIADCPGKRAAFEILTELAIDWDKARRMEPQDDEPWRSPNLRQGDMLLTAEAGWMGDMVHGRNRWEEVRAAFNQYLVEIGRTPIDWAKEAE